MSNQTVTDCEGTLFDSGGFFDDYSAGENFVFTICPEDPTVCLQMEFIQSSIGEGDQISFFDGTSTAGDLLGTYTGTIPPAIGAPSGCMTVLFTSDFFAQSSGWIANWTCSNEECDSPPPPVPSPQDCINAIPVCQEVYFEQDAYQGVGNIPGEINSNISCLGSGEMNDVWYVFTVQESGDLGFLISPNVGFDDYDWAVYNLTNNECSEIASLEALSVSCNYSGDSGETGATGATNSTSEGGGGVNQNALIPVIEGETYVLNVSQFSFSTNGYTLDFGLSTATIFDVSPPEIINVVTPTGCESNDFSFETTENVLCAEINPADFVIEGPGGPYTVIDVVGEVCAVGAEADNAFSLIVQPEVVATGDYTLSINAAFVDQCGNTSVPLDPIPFFVQGTDFVGDVSDVSVCAGESAVVEVVGDGVYNFYTADGVGPNNFLMAGSSFDYSDLVGTDVEYIAIVTQIENGCETAPVAVSILVSSQADASFEDLELCPYHDAEFLVPATAGGTWSGEGVNEDGLFDPADVDDSATYSITYTIDGDCGDSYTGSVTVREILDADFSDASVCEGDAPIELDDLMNPDEDGGFWTVAGNVDGSTLDPSEWAPGEYEVYHVVTDNFCSFDAFGTLTVVSGAGANGSPNFDGGTLCEGDGPLNLDPDTDGGEWEGEGVSQDGFFDPEGLEPGEYEITYTLGEGNCTVSNSETVTIFATGNADFSVSDICVGTGPFQLEAETAGGDWDGSSITDDGLFDPSDLAPGDYNITYTVGNGPCEDSNTETITIFDDPDADFDDETVCEDDNAFNMNPDQDGGTWSGPGVSSSGVFDPDDVGPGTYTLTYEIEENGCSDSSTGTVTVLSSGDAFFPAPDLCFEGPEFQLEATEPGGIWEGEGVDENGMFDPAGLDPGFYEVTHFVGEEGCLDAHTGVVVIYEQISIEIVDGPDCIDYTGEYEVTFEISGGGIGPYSVEGDITVTAVDGNQVSFMGTGAGQVLDFTVTDMTSACEGSITWIAPDCPTCNPDAGEMAAETIYACVSDSVETHALGAIIDPDAILIYAVHSNSTFNEDEIITFNESGIFYQSDIGAAMNTTYYVSGVVGTDLGGFVDYNDGCTDITPSSTPIVYLMPITMSATTDCAIGTGVFSTTFTVSGGLPAFDGSSYTGGGDLEGVSLGNGDSYTVEGYFDQGTYSATATDGWSCAGSITEGPNDCLLCSASVEMPQSETIICQDGEAGGAAFNVELDGYDLFYVVHDDPVNLPGNIVGVKPASSNGIFYFSDLFGTASYATDYYVSAVIAPDAGDGTPDLTHPCLTIAVGPKVVWLGPVTFDTEILCDEDAGIYEVMVNIAGGYPEYVPGEDYLINLGGLNQIQLFAEDLPYNIGPFVAGSIFEIYATDDWDCDQTGFVSDAIDCKAGEECPETQSLAEAICSEDGLTYDLVVSVTGGTEGFTLEDLSTGAVVSTDLPSEGAYVVEGIPAGTEYSYVLFDNSNLDCATVLTGAPSCTPPVSIELIRFAGEAQSDGNYLYWYTATEFESDYFELQGSKDGISWEVIAQVEAAGLSNTQMNYDFLDASAEGLTYYRLNEVDQAGKETLSNVIALNRSSDSFMVGSIAPVPTSGISQVNIESVNNNIITVSLFDLAGRMMMNREVELTEGANQFDVDLSSFSSGIYMLNIQDGITEMNYKLIRD